MSAHQTSVAGRTDVGRVREANEDAYFVGESIVAVADGMGGHLAGEVASATALEPVQALDGRVFEDGPAALSALRDAVVQANATVSKMAHDEPTYRGMGTTLTVAMLEGRRLHLAHVGDSRAYLLRGDRFSQLTDDHTLVQHLVDEGQITREEAAVHPQRSIITRAIGVSPEIDVDALSIELDPGDQLLLCSDGLTGVLEDEAIARELRAGHETEATLTRLIEAANEGGGPDNVTAVLLRYGDATTAAGAATRGDDEDGEDTGPFGGPDPEAAGGARSPVLIGTRTDAGDGDWARRLGNYGALTPTGPSGDDEDRPLGRRVRRIVAVVLAVAVLVGLAVLGGRFLLDRSYYVGLDGEAVVIYRGVDIQLGPLDLSTVHERTDLTADEVPRWYAEALEDGITAADLGDARRIVTNAPRRDEVTEDGDPAGGPGTDAPDTDGAADDDEDAAS
jgi:PPM family protein phosphatase